MKKFYLFSKTHLKKNLFLIGYSDDNGQPVVDILHQDHGLKSTSDYLLLYTLDFLVQHQVKLPIKLVTVSKHLPIAYKRIKKWASKGWPISNLSVADIYAKHIDTGKPTDDFYDKVPNNYPKDGHLTILKRIHLDMQSLNIPIYINVIDPNNPASRFLAKYAAHILGVRIPRYRVLSTRVSDNEKSQFVLICHKQHLTSKQMLRKLVDGFIHNAQNNQSSMHIENKM